MAARDSVSKTARDDSASRAKLVHAETPPADYWQRWSDKRVAKAEPLPAAPAPKPIAAAIPEPSPVMDFPSPTAPAEPVFVASAVSAPASTRSAGLSVDSGAQELPTGESAYRVLIVEDDRSQALFAQSVLHGAGMDARVEMSAASVQQAINEYRPDLILMDLHMPDLDGIRLTTLIRQHPQHQLLPIVFLTGDPDPERQFEVLDSGADDFLTKPIRPRHLIAAVSNRIRRARQQSQVSTGIRSETQSNPETGLPTRSYLMQQLTEALQTKATGGLLFIEIASALGLRERYGYAAFERLMIQAGHRLAAAGKPYPLARLNDNSFLLLVRDVAEQGLEALATHMRTQLAGHAFQVRDDETVHLRSSIGFAPLTLNFDDAGAALEAVESAAIQARLRSEGVLAYVPASVKENEEQLKMVSGQLELAYQPIVAVAGGDTAQYQVLLRIRQPDGTLLSAGQIIPAAESAGRIADLDQQVLDHSLGLLQLYQHSPTPLRLFVSQSPRTLAREAFSNWLLESLVKRSITGTSLVIDLRLEDALIHAVTVQQFCSKLMPEGVQFCLSQFEPGPEANALLTQLPLGFVRLSGRFANTHQDAKLRDELKTTIELAHRAGLQIIGQQIEDAQAAAAMWMGGVDFIQGNLVQSVGNDLNFDFQSAVL